MKELNEILLNALQRLNNDDIMSNYGEEEVRRTNAISKASQTIINNVKLKMTINELANKTGKTINEIETELNIDAD